MNLTERILARKAGLDSVTPGQLILAEIDVAVVSDIQFPVFRRRLEEFGGKITIGDRGVLVGDHYLPAATPDQGQRIREMIDFAEEHGLAHCFVREGIKHQVLAERGFVRPGCLVAASDSHTNTLGALGAFGTALGASEIAAAFATGKMWFKVPETIEISLAGEFPIFVYAKDLALEILRKFGTSFARYRSLEFTGPAAHRLSIEERMTVCNMSTEMGAKACIFEPDEETARYLSEAGVTVDPQEWRADPGAKYAERILVDLGELTPLVAAPHSPGNVKPVREVAGTRITQAFIGGCANATLSDLAIAAEILKGRRVARHVQMIVTPATQWTLRAARRAGYVDVLEEAGAIVTNAGCGACPGIHLGVMGPTDVRISSQNRNFIGRSGHPDSQIYLSSPAVVAASAIRGEVTDPLSL